MISSATNNALQARIQLLLQTGKMLMENGADTNRVVRDMNRLAVYMGFQENQLRLHILNSVILVDLKAETGTNFCQCEVRGVNMDVIAKVSRLIWRAAEEHYCLEDYKAALEAIEATPKKYSPLTTCYATALACAALSILFGGDLPAAVSTAICAVIGIRARGVLTGYGVNPYACVGLSSFAATFFAWLAQSYVVSATPWIPMVACGLVFIPGVPLINAVDDLVNNYIASGMTRAMNALLIIGGMTFGVVLAMKVGNVSEFASLTVAFSEDFTVSAIAAAVASLGFAVIFNLPPSLLLPAVAGGALAVGLRNLLLFDGGAPLPTATAAGAVAVSLFALFWSRRFRVPTHVFSIPAVIPMMPGVPLYRLLFSIINIDTQPLAVFWASLQGGIQAVLVLIAISVGVAIPNLVARHYIDKAKKEKLDDLLRQAPVPEAAAPLTARP